MKTVKVSVKLCGHGSIPDPRDRGPLALSFAPKLPFSKFALAVASQIAVLAQCRQRNESARRAPHVMAHTTGDAVAWSSRFTCGLTADGDADRDKGGVRRARHRHRAAARRLHSLHFVETAGRALQLHKQPEDKTEKEYYTAFTIRYRRETG
jgi:hypothetical protein